MPNWCDNNLYISHPDPKMMEKAIDAWNSGKFLATLVPEPDYNKVKVKHTFPMNMATGKEKPEFVEPDQAWWDWRVQNWGTKWDVGYQEGEYGDKAQLDKEGAMFVYFNSAWSPPTDAYAKLMDMGYSIKAYYYEGGCAFCGIWQDGEEDFYNIDPPEGVKTSVWVRENIPKELDNEMDIADSYESFEEDEEEEDA
jgi:hypothetical protein